MDKITDNTNLGYVSYRGQETQLRKLAIEKFGLEAVAMMSNNDVCDRFRKEGYVPMVVHLDDGCCNTETIYLFKEDELDKAIKLCR